jgi:hypothetical protein
LVRASVARERSMASCAAELDHGANAQLLRQLVELLLALVGLALTLPGRGKLPLIVFSCARHTSSMHPARGQGQALPHRQVRTTS